MKKINLLLISLATFGLFGCNMGDIISGDEQTINVTGGTTPNTFQAKGTALNCRINPGNCQVTLTTYSAKGNLVGSQIWYSIGTSSIINSGCTTGSPNCQFTIQQSQISNQQNVRFEFHNGSNIGISNQSAFVIGGGI